MARGTLRIFLGAAPGVGKTYAMLREGHLLRAAGEDVVVGFARDRGRRDTRELLAGLDAVRPRRVAVGQVDVGELDLDAVLLRAPGTALVDEYAHANVPGSRNLYRWEDVEELLAAGINVLSTLDIQQLASLADVVSAVTHGRPAQTVPDAVVRRADQLQLVDLSPALLRQRLSDGKVVPPDRIDAALSNDFRPGRLAALRGLALLWLADRVDEGLAGYREGKADDDAGPRRERVVVGLSGSADGTALIRRGARLLSRVSGTDLLAVHVIAPGGVDESPQILETQRQLVQNLGGSYHVVTGEDPAVALLDFARSVNASQLVLGVSPRSAAAGLLLPWRRGGATAAGVLHGAAGVVDVHLVPRHTPPDGVPSGTQESPGGEQGSRPPRRRGELGRRRVSLGFCLAVVVPALIQLLLALSADRNLATSMLLQLTGSVLVALVGGLWPAVLAALWSSLLVNFFSTPPLGNLAISDAHNVLALLVFVGVSAAVAVVVDVSARRAKEAARARAEATALAELSRGADGAEDSITGLLERALDLFQVRGAALFGVTADADGVMTAGANGPWRLLAGVGDFPPATDAAITPLPAAPQGENVEQINATTRLVLSGRVLPASDRRLLGAFGVHLLAQLENQQLLASRSQLRRLAESNSMRTSLLRAVSHDLRTPLAGIKLAVGGLRQRGVRYTREEERELLETIEECSDQLDTLVGNLLDMSRITSDSVQPLIRPVRWYEVIHGALHGIPADRIRVELPPNMPEVEADPGLLERVVANIVENAVKYAPQSDIVLTGSSGGLGPGGAGGRPAGEMRIIDHGAGVPADKVVEMFRPFQRLDDTGGASGVGLGLAVARGFIEAMGGRLSAEPTPGGGLTMAISLPLSEGAPFEGTPDQAPLEPQSALIGRHHAPPLLSSPTDVP